MVRKEIWMHLPAHNLICKLMATHRVNDRPHRVEPRAAKRQPKKQVYLTVPRPLARAFLLNPT
jgi:hypothetical protein